MYSVYMLVVTFKTNRPYAQLNHAVLLEVIGLFHVIYLMSFYVVDH